jgi:tRNA pseudouridine55 synthase
MATGVLVILIGSATKRSQELSGEDKEYEATMTLGARSDTADAWGRLEPSGCKVDFSSEEIASAFGEFEGEIDQAPPMYSAVKFKGKKLYQLARKGISVETKQRKVSIKELNISGISMPQVSFRLTCSKGTYVRQLCADIGERLGCGGYLSQLRRTRSGSFGIDGAIQVDELKCMSAPDIEKRLTGP